MKCRTENIGGQGGVVRTRVTLKDWKDQQSTLDISAYCKAKKTVVAEKAEVDDKQEGKVWEEAIIGLRRFSGVDFEQLKEISITLLTNEKKAEGSLWIDEIAFYGANEVAFESLADNLVGFPKTVFNHTRARELKKIENDKHLIREIARDTWRYFENAFSKSNHLVVDHIRTGDPPLAANYTSPSNIAMDLMASVAARELGFITRGQAIQRSRSYLETLRNLRKWNGLFYNFYETTKMTVTRKFISSVDNGWLAIALVVIRQAFDGELYHEATEVLDAMDFSQFIDYENNQLVVGYDEEKEAMTEVHYGMLVSEARATSLLAIGKGDVSEDHWWSLFRTAPSSWTWQNQKPKGQSVQRGKANIFQGYYIYENMPIVPSWGGSLFEYLMPTLVLEEGKKAAKSFGMNNERAVRGHIIYAQKKGYPIWGISPAATTNGRRWKYDEYGIKELGVKGYSDKGVFTPHVSFLALAALPEEAIKNIRAMLDLRLYGDYGFYDSIKFPSRRVNTQYLALDQGMIFLAAANYLKDGLIRGLFHKDPYAQKAEELWREERFFES